MIKCQKQGEGNPFVIRTDSKLTQHPLCFVHNAIRY